MQKDVLESDAEEAASYGVPEDPARLLTLLCNDAECNADTIVRALKCDQVVLVQNALPRDADDIVASVAKKFGLLEQLEFQAAAAPIAGNRENIGKYFTSVDQRDDYQFLASHSESNRNTCAQLACLFCFENTTDGGVTILQNTDDESESWGLLREVVVKIDPCGKRLSTTEIMEHRVMLNINAEDALTEDDVVVQEWSIESTGRKYFDVLAKPRKEYSRILNRSVNVYWGDISCHDFDSGRDYIRLLQCRGLLRAPSFDLDISQLDRDYSERVWSSGVRYEDVFKAMIVRKLAPGDLIIQNNLTWTHSASNWTPGSGQRTVAVAFA